MKKDFEEIVYGHQFEFESIGKMEEGKRFRCDFCGGIGSRYVKLRRDDGGIYQVGMTCAEKTGLRIRSIWKKQLLKMKKGAEVDISGEDMKVPKKQKKEKVEEKKEGKKKKTKVKKKAEPKKEVSDEDINKMLDDLDDIGL